MKKIGRNDKCSCGSGIKYKNCCLEKNKPTKGIFPNPGKSLYDKIANGELPFNSRIISKEGETSSMDISYSSITIGGQTKVLIDENITLSTNTVGGDKSEISAASIKIPIIDTSKGTIETTGNAQVLNNQRHLDIEIKTDKNKMSLRSSKGLFASIKISQQKNQVFNYLTILFGVKNNKEFINEEGRKNRSDIAIYPSGNGKFIRLSDENGDYDSTWEITNEITFETTDKIMYPKTITLISSVYQEKLKLNFEFSNNKVLLVDGNFE